MKQRATGRSPTVARARVSLSPSRSSCARFDKARERAGIDKAKFQFRDLRARGVTHKTIDEGLEAGQRLAGHSGPGMTARYVRGARPVKPSR
ncbi:integrase [Burkholderia multivorans]|uniref:integrase n=1 Tax=Burkholderia multivorans TaxID=87883 RepID=UPI0021BE3BF3|nr:integrase [Burkholderia multivorans]